MTTLQSHRLTDALNLADMHRGEAYLGTADLMHALLTTRRGVAGHVFESLPIDFHRFETLYQERDRGAVFVGAMNATPRARLAMDRAGKLATEEGSSYVGTGHLLQALLYTDWPEPDSPFQWLADCGAARTAIQQALRSVQACDLAWRMEFDCRRDGEVYWQPLDPRLLAWRDGICCKLAASIRDERSFGQLPILGDALEEAGCTDQGVLRHCRQSPGTHLGWCCLVESLLDLSTLATTTR